MVRRLVAADVTHGDFGPNNLLLDPATHEITGILDWEWGHPGSTALDDLAWCEWIVRMHHPGSVGALGELFAGYGSRPPWPDRRAAMLARCAELLALRRSMGPDDPGEARWLRFTALTEGWAELLDRDDAR
jgi:aminoglycoside phosphotransferase (APT) family kinase protein